MAETQGQAQPKGRTPGYKFGLIVLLGLLLAVPLFSVYLLVYDRQSQSETARGSIVEGWGDRQELAGPFLVIPFSQLVETSTTENGREVKRVERQERALFVAPADVAITTALAPELRRRSIYEAVIYSAQVEAKGRFLLPDFARSTSIPRRCASTRRRSASAYRAPRGSADRSRWSRRRAGRCR